MRSRVRRICKESVGRFFKKMHQPSIETPVWEKQWTWQWRHSFCSWRRWLSRDILFTSRYCSKRLLWSISPSWSISYFGNNDSREVWPQKNIPKFNGSASGSVVNWMEKAELVYKMCQMKHLEHIVPLRLMSGVLTVYQQLKRRISAR